MSDDRPAGIQQGTLSLPRLCRRVSIGAAIHRGAPCRIQSCPAELIGVGGVGRARVSKLLDYSQGDLLAISVLNAETGAGGRSRASQEPHSLRCRDGTRGRRTINQIARLRRQAHRDRGVGLRPIRKVCHVQFSRLNQRMNSQPRIPATQSNNKFQYKAATPLAIR